MPADSRERQPLLGLAGELRLAHLHRQHEAHAVPDVLGRELEPRGTRLRNSQNSRTASRRPDAQAVDVRAALGGRDQIDVALGDALLGLEHPGEAPNRASRPRCRACRRRSRRAATRPCRAPRPGTRAARRCRTTRRFSPVISLLSVTAQVRAQHRLGAQHLLQARHRELVGVEVFRIGPEAHRGAGLRLRHVADHLELGGGLAVREAQVVFLAAAAHPALEVLGQRVDHRDADAVQAARVLVGLVVEFAARVQAREDQLDAADLLLRDGCRPACRGRRPRPAASRP